MSDWLIICGMVAVTYSVRLSVIALLGETRLPESLNRALRYVPPAALAAIVFPSLFMPADHLDFTLGNVRMLAGVAAALVAWRTKSALLAIGVGMVLLWILQAI